MKLSVCILVIGDLGKTGSLSLNTLVNIDLNRLCVLANESGKRWLHENIPSELKSKLCFHDEPLEEFEFKHVVLKENYSEYRSMDFRILTLLKWDLLRSSMRIHPGTEMLFFTDLDVYWFRDPKPLMKSISETEHNLYIQDDSSKSRPLWCCTGVMFWKNNSYSQVKLEELHSLHRHQIEAGHLQDDEDTFNQFITSSTKEISFSRLSQNEFVVGRNFGKIILNRSLRERTICFHANYLTGLDRKEKSLSAVHKLHTLGTYPILEMLRFYFLPKLRRIREGIKRRLK